MRDGAHVMVFVTEPVSLALLGSRWPALMPYAQVLGTGNGWPGSSILSADRHDRMLAPPSCIEPVSGGPVRLMLNEPSAAMMMCSSPSPLPLELPFTPLVLVVVQFWTTVVCVVCS